MANYTPTFTKPYPSGWVDKPSKTTPATAAIMNSYDAAIAALEAYLRDNAIKSVSADTTVKSGTKIATITIDGTEYVIYSPNVSYESAITGGTKVGTITVGTNTFDVYAPASSAGGSTVSVVPKTLTGTNIAEITVDDTTYQLYAPTGGSGSGSTVTAEATLTEGTQIGKITIDGTETILYAPTASTITVDDALSATSENPVQNKIVKAEFDKIDDSLSVLGKCKNLLNPTLNTTTQNGVTCTANGDGTYTLNGTASETTVFVLNDIQLSAGNYKMVGCPNGGSQNTYKLNVYSEALQTTYLNDYGGGETENVSALNGRTRIVVYTNTTVNNLVFKPMLTTNLNATYDDFVPYTGDGDNLTADVAKINSDLSDIKDGTTPVAKAVADEDGNNIKSTYATKAEAFIDYSSIAVDLNTLTTEPSLISIGYDATNKPSKFYGGYMFVVMAGYTASIALYQILFDVFYNKTYQRKYYHGAWTDWQETNSGITIDSVLSNTSVNPVQNKIITAKLNEVFQSVSDGKSLIASAITDKGVNTAADATFQTMATNIGKISGSGSAEVNNPLSMIGNFNFESKIVLADELSAENITITKDSTNIPITSVAKTNDTKFKLQGDFSAISADDVIKVQTNPGFFFDANLQSTSDVSVVVGDTRFEINNPELASTIKLGNVIVDYYAYSTIQPTDNYWAIGMFAKTTEGYIIAIVVSTISEYAYAVTSSFPTPYGGQLSLLYDDGQTYYFNAGIGGARQVGFDKITNNIVPIYKVNDSNFTNNTAGWTYMAKKLLDFYFGVEKFPS